MNSTAFNYLKYLGLWSLVFGLWSGISGCIRLSAGVTKYGAEDEAPKTKSVALDTQKLIPGSPQNSGSIDIPAQ